MDFKLIRKFIENSFEKEGSLKHLEKTLYWVEKLKPDASESLKIAALMHDIERPFRKESTKGLAKQFGFDYPEFLKIHQEKGADIAKKFLLENGYDENISNEVAGYIKCHEVGGTREQNILMEADSLSFLEDSNKISFIKKIKTGESDKGKVQKKFNFMFNRIRSEKAQEIAVPFYEKALKELENI